MALKAEDTLEIGVESLPEDLKNKLIQETTISRTQAEIVENTLHELLIKELKKWETRTCIKCGKQFKIQKNKINTREDKGLYCSATCYYQNVPRLGWTEKSSKR